MALCWQAVILSLRSRSLKSVNAGDVKNKCLSVQPWWFHPNQLSWLAGSLPLHNSRGGLMLVHLPTLFCGYITCRAFMLQHGFFFCFFPARASAAAMWKLRFWLGAACLRQLLEASRTPTLHSQLLFEDKNSAWFSFTPQRLPEAFHLHAGQIFFLMYNLLS